MKKIFSVLAVLLFLSSFVGTIPVYAAVPCAPGTFSDTGMEPCELAPPGYYVSNFGQTFATAADIGRYVNVYGATSAFDAPVGWFSPTTGMPLPMPVLPGQFQPSPGQFVGHACASGSASRGAAALCSPVGAGVPAAVGPELQLLGGASLSTSVFQGGGALVLTLINAAIDYGLGGLVTQDLTLLGLDIWGDAAGLFSVSGFVDGTVLAPGESLEITLLYNPALVGAAPGVANLSIRTDQGKQFGFDPAALFGDTESYYTFMRSMDMHGYDSLYGRGTISGEFTFRLVPLSSTFWLLLVGILSWLSLFEWHRQRRVYQANRSSATW